MLCAAHSKRAALKCRAAADDGDNGDRKKKDSENDACDKVAACQGQVASLVPRRRQQDRTSTKQWLAHYYERRGEPQEDEGGYWIEPCLP
eukprot:3723183-Pyramimonas_sp.AAC.1